MGTIEIIVNVHFFYCVLLCLLWFVFFLFSFFICDLVVSFLFGKVDLIVFLVFLYCVIVRF